MIARAPAKRSKEVLLARMNPGLFAVNFNKKPFLIEHALTDHDAFGMEALVELSRQLPADSVVHKSGEVYSHCSSGTSLNSMSVAEATQRIQQDKSWLVLKNIEQNPVYKQLLDECLDQIEQITCKISPGMRRREGFIVMTSPKSVSPYRIAPEQNFLLQVRGQQQVHMYNPMDREVLKEEAIEEFVAGARNDLEFDCSIHGRGHWFNLEPGQGLHFPVVAPHWVENGDEISVSFGMTFQNDESMRRQALHRFNRRLRKFGMTPSPVGVNAGRDATKYFFLNGLRKMQPWKTASQEI